MTDDAAYFVTCTCTPLMSSVATCPMHGSPLQTTITHANSTPMGEWKACPICNGRGVVLYDPAMPTHSTSATVGPWTCHVCHGAKVVLLPRLTTELLIDRVEMLGRIAVLEAENAALRLDLAGKESREWRQMDRDGEAYQAMIDRSIPPAEPTNDR